MNYILLALALAAADPKPIEEALATKENPNGKHVMVQTHILVLDANVPQGLAIKFIDAKPSPKVNIKKWDPKLSELKPNTTLLVTGELHFGPAPGGTPSIRYKVKEVGGRKYNDHRHWRTDKAIYMLNPTYKIVEPEKDTDKDPPAKQ